MADTNADTQMSTQEKAPFESLAFLFNDRSHGRITLRITKDENAEESLPAEPSPFDEFDFSAEGVAPSEMVEPAEKPAGLRYKLHYELGSAGRAKEDTVSLSLMAAQDLQASLVEAGVYLWDPEYGDNPSQPKAKWSLTVVLKEGVFTQTVRGGSDFPKGFVAMMNAFYEAGLPRPEQAKPAPSAPAGGFPFGGFPFGGMNPGAMGGMGNMGNVGNMGNPNDMFAAMQEMLSSGIPQQSLDEMRRAMDEMRDHPEMFQERLRSEFRSMDPQHQNELLDMLSSTGMGSREWWENFLRG